MFDLFLLCCVQEYIPEQKGKVHVYVASKTLNFFIHLRFKKGIWEKNLGRKEQETLHFEFPYGFHK